MKRIEYKNGDLINGISYIAEEGKASNGHRKALFKCYCGIQFIAIIDKVRRKETSSCGCFKAKRVKEINITHGFSYRKEYKTWSNIRRRCRDITHEKYEYYGGRGIIVCERWNDFQCFLDDMGIAPTNKHSIDRIENDGNYEPSNCRWATKQEQARNKSNNIKVEYNGEKRLLFDLLCYSKVAYKTLKIRVVNLKWDINKALSTPLDITKFGVGLKEEDKIKIKEMYLTKKYDQKTLGKIFNTSGASVSRIINDKRTLLSNNTN